MSSIKSGTKDRFGLTGCDAKRERESNLIWICIVHIYQPSADRISNRLRGFSDVCACLAADHMYYVEVGGNETQVTLRDLTPNKTYQLRIAAGTRAGFSQPSEWATHHTPNRTQGNAKT